MITDRPVTDLVTRARNGDLDKLRADPAIAALINADTAVPARELAGQGQ